MARILYCVVCGSTQPTARRRGPQGEGLCTEHFEIYKNHRYDLYVSRARVRGTILLSLLPTEGYKRCYITGFRKTNGRRDFTKPRHRDYPLDDSVVPSSLNDETPEPARNEQDSVSRPPDDNDLEMDMSDGEDVHKHAEQNAVDSDQEESSHTIHVTPSAEQPLWDIKMKGLADELVDAQNAFEKEKATTAAKLDMMKEKIQSLEVDVRKMEEVINEKDERMSNLQQRLKEMSHSVAQVMQERDYYKSVYEKVQNAFKPYQ